VSAQSVITTEPIVHCYSGHTYADHPLSFEWQGECLTVACIESSRRVYNSRDGSIVIQFTAETSNHRRFRLSYSEINDAWTVDLVSVMRSAETP
jgi:hypothetical protein